ncbi:MAG: GGDEF domain-containing protein [Sulfuritalea sp.]|nr:GGDEF domain-containing protein [Sulfuritalea sp.]
MPPGHICRSGPLQLVNDTYGHGEGDRLLKSFAERLSGLLRSADTLARQGGDEFTIILPDLARTEDAAFIAGKIVDSMRKPFKVAGQDFIASVSIGIAGYPRDGETPETLMRHADLAMYSVKKNGKNAFAFFTTAMSQGHGDRIALWRTTCAAPPSAVSWNWFTSRRSRRAASHAGRRSAPALAPSHPWRDRPAAFPGAGRGCRLHPSGQRLGARRGLPSDRALAFGRPPGFAHLRQPLPALIRTRRHRRPRHRRDQGPRAASGNPGSGNHRKPAAAGCRTRHRKGAHTARSRCAGRHRRFWHPLFITQLPQAVSRQQHQDRPVVHSRPGQRCRRRGHCQRLRRHRRRLRSAARCRRRRNRYPGRLAAQPWLRHHAGISFRAAFGRRRAA